MNLKKISFEEFHRFFLRNFSANLFSQFELYRFVIKPNRHDDEARKKKKMYFDKLKNFVTSLATVTENTRVDLEKRFPKKKMTLSNIFFLKKKNHSKPSKTELNFFCNFLPRKAGRTSTEERETGFIPRQDPE